jgi:hypothetical protein
MNWNAIGSVGEAAGAVAVVASLIYLALQIRQNTQEVRAAAVDSVIASIREWTRPVIENAEAAEIFYLGCQDPEQLDELQRYRFIAMVFTWLKTAENFHYKHQQGVLDPDVWNAWTVMLSAYIAQPGFQAYWRERRAPFTPAFGAWVDSIVHPEDFATTQKLVDTAVGRHG